MARRRDYGSGSISQRADGRIQGSIPLPNGKRKYVYGKSRAEVARKLREAQAELAAGKLAYSDRQTLGDWLARWLESRPDWSPRTLAASRHDVETKIAPALGKVQLARLTPGHVREFYADLRRRGYAPNTIKGVHGTLSGALTQAVRDEVIGRNVASLVTLPTGNVRETVAYDADQLRRFLEAIAGDRHEAMWLMLVSTGIRAGELLGMRWADIDFERGKLTLVRQAQSATTKTKAGRRSIDLHSRLLAALRRHRAAQNEHRLSIGPYWEDHGLVFAREDGHPYSQTRFRDGLFYPLLERAGLPRTTPHGLRHSFATYMLGAGVSMALVSTVMGHRQVSTTLDIYGHLELAPQGEVLRALDKLFGKIGPEEKVSDDG